MRKRSRSRYTESKREEKFEAQIVEKMENYAHRFQEIELVKKRSKTSPKKEKYNGEDSRKTFQDIKKSKKKFKKILKIFLELKYYEKKLIAYKERTSNYESILEKLCEISSSKSYDLLPVVISRAYSKIHYSKYLEYSKLYQKLESKFEELNSLTKNIFMIYKDKGNIFEKMKKKLKKIKEIFDRNSKERNF